MIRFHLLYVLFYIWLLPVCAQPKVQKGQPKLIGSCEGCEAIFEYGQKELSAVDTLPGFHDPGMKIKISGTVYQNDGITPAPGVILYVYHTNQEGLYENKYNATNWERRHGYIRGWMKTGNDGRYIFYTLKPKAYPSRSEPAHIHLTLQEPDGKYYWLGSYYFAGDPLLSEEERSPDAPRGASPGILHLKNNGALWTGERDIVLGKNIPGYE